MADIRKIKAGLVKLDRTEFVGEEGNLFFDIETGQIFLSDGVTPGGFPISSAGGNLSLTVNTISSAESEPLDEISNISTISFDSQSFSTEEINPGNVKVVSLNTGNLVFTQDGVNRVLTGFRENSSVSTVRSAALQNDSFILTIATFTPILSATTLPSSTLDWDQPCTGFRVSIVNPDDFTSEYISSVASLTPITGSITADITQFTDGDPSLTPAPTIDWIQDFTTNTNAVIVPSATTGIDGGIARGTLLFDSTVDGVESVYTEDSATWTATWRTPNVSISMSNLSGKTFLDTYDSTSYTVTVTGMSDTGNVSNTVVAVGGTVSNNQGSGTFTFSDPIQHDEEETRSVTVTTTLTRPASVTGTEYTATDTATDSVLVATFSYPSFWLFTAGTSTVPTQSDVVSGSTFIGSPTVNTLGSDQKNFGAIVDNTGSDPRAFWFGVRTVATQPTQFKTGVSADLLSDVAFVQNTVSLQPDSPPNNYIAVGYTLYGIVLQPGETYVSIS